MRADRQTTMPVRQIHYLVAAAATAAIAVFGPAPVPQAQTPATQPSPRDGGQGAGAGGAQTIPPVPGRGRGVQGAPALDDPAKRSRRACASGTRGWVNSSAPAA
jgi:hypothetical protein